MNIKKLIVPIGSLVVVIAALIIGVVLINKPTNNNTQNDTAKPAQPDSSLEVSIREADSAYNRGDYAAAVTQLEKVRTTYQDQNKKQQADEISDKIESIKALQKQQQPNENANKTPAPIAQ